MCFRERILHKFRLIDSWIIRSSWKSVTEFVTEFVTDLPDRGAALCQYTVSLTLLGIHCMIQSNAGIDIWSCSRSATESCPSRDLPMPRIISRRLHLESEWVREWAPWRNAHRIFFYFPFLCFSFRKALLNRLEFAFSLPNSRIASRGPDKGSRFSHWGLVHRMIRQMPLSLAFSLALFHFWYLLLPLLRSSKRVQKGGLHLKKKNKQNFRRQIQ